MKKIWACLLLLHTISFGLNSKVPISVNKKPLIQLCLIIDVSGSMNDLLLQAQTQIWGLLEYTSKFQLRKKSPDVEIAVMTIGDFTHLGQGTRVNYQIVSDFTRDIAQLADQMFLLKLGGGNEFFGLGIDKAIDELSWQNKSDFKSIIVAGNESFAQGPVNYELACKKAFQNGVIVNTIFCGKYDEGENLFWKEASVFGGGEFTIMELENEGLNKRTPFDDNIIGLYNKFIATYQLNIEKIKIPTPANGTISPVYRNMILKRMRDFQAPKDIIDLFEESNWDFDAIQPQDIPEKLKGLKKEELQEYLVKTTQRRSNAREGLTLYQKKIEEFLDVKLGKKAGQKTLDLAAKEVITAQLLSRGFKFNEDSKK